MTTNPPLVTVPSPVVPGERYREKNGHFWAVYGWQEEGCSCIGPHGGDGTSDDIRPAKDCRTCEGTGRGGLCPDLIAEGLLEEDAAALAAFPALHAAARDALALLGTLSAADCLGDRHAAAAEATGKKLYAALTAAEARPCAST